MPKVYVSLFLFYDIFNLKNSFFKKKKNIYIYIYMPVGQ